MSADKNALAVIGKLPADSFPGAGDPISDADIRAIEAMIPHRPPFLLVDRVECMRRHVYAKGIKNVSISEPHFQGHFPGFPIMPGVLIVESMAQTAAVLVAASVGDEALDKLVYFTTMEDVRFRKPVVPGDRLELHVSFIRARSKIYKFNGEARVGDAVHASAVFSAMIADRPK
jgi:3-hydroxyacyl-[acyl-carrier-protein] dehydratase